MGRWALLFLFLSACAGPQNPFQMGAMGTPVEDGLTIGNRLMAAGEAELALDEYTRAAGEFGFTTQVNASIGRANLALGRLRQAEPFLRRATQAPDATPEMWNNLGVLLLETDRLPEARQVFRRGFAMSNGQNVTIQRNLTKTLAKLDAAGYSNP